MVDGTGLLHLLSRLLVQGGDQRPNGVDTVGGLIDGWLAG